MKKFLVIISALFLIHSALAQSSGMPEKLLPNILLRDDTGKVINTESLRNTGNWVFIVADASLPSTRSLLSGLSAKNEPYDQQTTVLMIGSESQIKELATAREKLTGLRWVYSTEPFVIKSLGLAGAPSILGMRADGRIAWQFSGLPAPAEKLTTMILAWLRNPS
jgi:hypothetical protein